MFNIAMWHEIFKIMFLAVLVFTAFILALRVFAGITYKLAHKKTKRNLVKKVNKANTEIQYNIGDTSKMYLFEIKTSKNKLRRELIANI
ncbi:MAG: hypothetical protein HFJ20_01365 [Clostridia bacterium]|nr:hypothetical protein [Clostridia bacterium]